MGFRLKPEQANESGFSSKILSNVPTRTNKQNPPIPSHSHWQHSSSTNPHMIRTKQKRNHGSQSSKKKSRPIPSMRRNSVPTKQGNQPARLAHTWLCFETTFTITVYLPRRLTRMYCRFFRNTWNTWCFGVVLEVLRTDSTGGIFKNRQYFFSIRHNLME